MSPVVDATVFGCHTFMGGETKQGLTPGARLVPGGTLVYPDGKSSIFEGGTTDDRICAVPEPTAVTPVTLKSHTVV